MADYITKEQVRDIMATHYPYANLREETAMHHINEDIKHLPAADVVEVVHGEWIDRGYAANGDMIGMCSACRRTFRGMKEIGSVGRYCPNCGAKMDGGANNG